MKAIEIRNKYLEFFKNHNHSVIPSAPLIPENDPSVLFNTAGIGHKEIILKMKQ